MKNVLKLVSIFLLLISINACKDKDCIGPDCRLADGTTCANNWINVGGECVCPEGYLQFGEKCLERGGDQLDFIGDLDCNCLKQIYLGLDSSNSVDQIYYNFVLEEGTFDGNITNAIGLQEFFSFTMFGNVLNCGQGNDIQVQFVGRLIEDTVHADLYWRQPGPNFNTPIDSCVGIKIPKL